MILVPAEAERSISSAVGGKTEPEEAKRAKENHIRP